MLTAGNQANTGTPNNITTKTAMTNSGSEPATSAETDSEWSTHESRLAAAHIPSRTPRIVEMIAVSTISTSELASRGTAISQTGSLCVSEVPKSPRSAEDTQLRYPLMGD